ncbi:hypothetical protein GKJPGBOP_03055 [Streptomyces paromomycinus]|uniref:Uncharacterized protein n=1 Tax=Streptomyces paromomycinus TaxID=92743 RepID=A0A401W224_STREY|nr:hypothetical protein GKJPGBOP_03055 [Streptomyces paromomycinus]
MRTGIHVFAVFAAGLCVGGFLVGGTAVVVALVLAGVAALTWQVAAASRPRPRTGTGSARRRSGEAGARGGAGVPGGAGAAPGASGVRIGHQ